ncbi:MAG: pyridoxal phosphate-dependent aminotransferase [Thermoplasmata archaeon]
MRSFTESAMRLRPNAAFEYLAMAKDLERQGKNILHFEIGEPNFDTPAHISDAAIAALRGGKTRYVKSSGIPELKDAICEEVERTRGFRPEPDQVLVAPGGNPLIYFLVTCVAEQGQNIALQDPGFLTYFSVLQCTGVKGNFVRLKEENEFRMDPEDLDRVIDDDTRLIILNSPSNPTGGVMKKSEIERVAEMAEEHDVYLLADEIYSKMTYDRPHHSAAVRDECKERTVLLDGFSKSYAMTGWRLGYAVGPKELIKKMTMVLEATVSCTPDFLQYGGIAALNGPQYVKEMMNTFRQRRDLLIAGLNSIPKLSCVMPQGAFYAFPNITKTGMNSREFADFAINELGIALLPGTGFGPGGEGYIRLSYATSIETIKEAIDRLRAGLE